MLTRGLEKSARTRSRVLFSTPDRIFDSFRSWKYPNDISELHKVRQSRKVMRLYNCNAFCQVIASIQASEVMSVFSFSPFFFFFLSFSFFLFLPSFSSFPSRTTAFCFGVPDLKRVSYSWGSRLRIIIILICCKLIILSVSRLPLHFFSTFAVFFSGWSEVFPFFTAKEDYNQATTKANLLVGTMSSSLLWAAFSPSSSWCA